MNQSFALPYEPRPRDFTARLKRRGLRKLGSRARRKHIGRRALVLLTAVAVPALAAPDGWQPFDIGTAGSAELALEPMPFEQHGASFPGSAFYYLTSDESEPTALADAQFATDGTMASLTDFAGGPVARAMRMDLSGIDRTRALDCLTAAIYYEAASEPDQGQRAVAQVVLNRVAHPAYPNTVCGVVYQGSERVTGCQFSFTCDGALARRPSAFFWDRARRTAMAALSGYVEPSVGLATHYHTIQIHPYWAPSLNFITTIGAHRFYSFKGKAGQSGTFRFAYAGGEPMAAPHARNPAADKIADPVLDPLALQKAYDSGLQSAVQANPGALNQAGDVGQAPARPAPAPRYAPDVEQRGGDRQYTGDKLPDTTGVKPEFQNSGKWIGNPGG
ncbi:MAG: cell wall hydrolase [Sphingomonadales bacterium]|nr:cell wall hydrolase [Sphingomonadales bacterium]